MPCLYTARTQDPDPNAFFPNELSCPSHHSCLSEDSSPKRGKGRRPELFLAAGHAGERALQGTDREMWKPLPAPRPPPPPRVRVWKTAWLRNEIQQPDCEF